MFSQIRQRLEAHAIAYALVGALAVCVLGFALFACFLGLLEILTPALAALVTAAVAVLLIAIVLLGLRIANATPARSAPRGRQRDPAERLEQMLQQHADPVLTRWVRDNPDKAVATTVALGVAAGYSDTVRRALADMYSQYVGAEEHRRAAGSG